MKRLWLRLQLWWAERATEKPYSREASLWIDMLRKAIEDVDGE
jgi:hypothetical protein